MTPKPLNVLLIGSGGREHALAWTIAASPLCARLVVAPGNPGIEELGRPGGPFAGKVVCVPTKADDTRALRSLAAAEAIGLVVCGPEAPLVAGLGDAFAEQGIPFFGPTKAAAEIEGSKAWAKDLMQNAGVPTAAYGVFEEVAAAEAFIAAQPGPVVVKADGLCAGKGVIVTSGADEARAAVREILGEKRFGAAGARVVIEERLQGREVSMMALCDGERFVLLPSAEDHKQVLDGDRGPNTGGMGAYSPSPLVDDALTLQIARTIFAPVVKALAQAGCPFRGLLYGGLMLTPRGPMVIEWNCRFGDPETQVVLERLEGDLLPWLLGAAEGQLPGGALGIRGGTSVCVVLAAEGYPGAVRTGDVIANLPPGGRSEEGALVLHAGTKRDGDRIVTAGGRVLGITADGRDLASARAKAYALCERIDFPGKHYRRDIGLRGQS